MRKSGRIERGSRTPGIETAGIETLQGFRLPGFRVHGFRLPGSRTPRGSSSPAPDSPVRPAARRASSEATIRRGLASTIVKTRPVASVFPKQVSISMPDLAALETSRLVDARPCPRLDGGLTGRGPSGPVRPTTSLPTALLLPLLRLVVFSVAILIVLIGSGAPAALGADPESECSSCEGKKEHACSGCEGEGRRLEPCPRCKASGKLDCWVESCTEGTKTCKSCQGRGRKSRSGITVSGKTFSKKLLCLPCQGTGRVDCRACRDGTDTCAKCRGKGRLVGTCSHCSGDRVEPCQDCSTEATRRATPQRDRDVDSIVSILRQARSLREKSQELREAIGELDRGFEASGEPAREFREKSESLVLPPEAAIRDLRTDFWAVRDLRDLLHSRGNSYFKIRELVSRGLEKLRVQSKGLETTEERLEQVLATADHWLEDRDAIGESELSSRLQAQRTFLSGERRRHRELEDSLEYLDSRSRSLDNKLDELQDLLSRFEEDRSDYETRNSEAGELLVARRSAENIARERSRLEDAVRKALRGSAISLESLRWSPDGSPLEEVGLTLELEAGEPPWSPLRPSRTQRLGAVLEAAFTSTPDLARVELRLAPPALRLRIGRESWESRGAAGEGNRASLLGSSVVEGELTVAPDGSESGERDETSSGGFDSLIWGLAGFLLVGALLFGGILWTTSRTSYRRKMRAVNP